MLPFNHRHFYMNNIDIYVVSYGVHTGILFILKILEAFNSHAGAKWSERAIVTNKLKGIHQ